MERTGSLSRFSGYEVSTGNCLQISALPLIGFRVWVFGTHRPSPSPRPVRRGTPGLSKPKLFCSNDMEDPRLECGRLARGLRIQVIEAARLSRKRDAASKHQKAANATLQPRQGGSFGEEAATGEPPTRPSTRGGVDRHHGNRISGCGPAPGRARRPQRLVPCDHEASVGYCKASARSAWGCLPSRSGSFSDEQADAGNHPDP